MASTDSFYQKCIYFTVIMFIFILLVNFISALDIFGVMSMGPATGSDPGNYLYETFGLDVSTTDIWGVALGIVGLTGVATYLLTQSTTIVGITIFSVVFWTGFINMYGIIGSLFVGTLSLFLGIGFAVVLIIFIAAIIGMLSGSG